MDVSTFRASASITISAPAEEIYRFIADMPRIGEISPECTGGAWENEDRGEGAIFIGSNTAGDRTWQRRIRVAVASPPREFSFENLSDATVPASPDDKPLARWRYTFTADDGGTRVEESWEFLDNPVLENFGEERMRTRQGTNQSGIEQTLANLKALLES
jgi:Polyketide cyclase / dehydrase and lipid transport